MLFRREKIVAKNEQLNLLQGELIKLPCPYPLDVMCYGHLLAKAPPGSLHLSN